MPGRLMLFFTLLIISRTTSFMPALATIQSELSMSRPGIIAAALGKARSNSKRKGAGGFGVGRKESEDAAPNLTGQVGRLVAQLTAQGNELADSKRLIDKLRAENEALRSELAEAEITTAVPATPVAAADSPGDLLWDDGYEETDRDAANFTMKDLLDGKVAGASSASPP